MSNIHKYKKKYKLSGYNLIDFDIAQFVSKVKFGILTMKISTFQHF